MSASILDGKALAQKIQGELAEEVADFIENNGVVPCLTAVLVGEDPASEVYVRNKQCACGRLGIDGACSGCRRRLRLMICSRSSRSSITMMPCMASWSSFLCPAGWMQRRVLQAVSPMKDVDCFHPENVGRLVQGRPRFLPCTPHGVQQLLLRNGVEIAGRRIVILGAATSWASRWPIC